MSGKKIKIGNQTNCNTPALVPFEFAIKNQFDAFEWFSDAKTAGWNEVLFDEKTLNKIRTDGQKSNITFSVHAPWQADPTNSKGVKAIFKSLEFAGKIKARLVNFHLFPECEIEKFVDAVTPVITKAHSSGIKISLENVVSCSPEYINRFFEALTNKVPANAAGLCLDIGHANLFSGNVGNFMIYAGQLSDKVPIIHVHAHENYGDCDSHLPLFTGPAAKDDTQVKQLITYLKKRDFCGSIIMEQWPQNSDLLIQARNRLLKIWE
jgi:sugar phosphate isomerase/epimerase